MLRNSLCLALAACYASVVSGLLLPPDFSSHSADKTTLLNLDPKSRSVHLPCLSCSFAPDRTGTRADEDDDAWVWLPGDSNEVLLDFRISDDGRHLLLNGEAIYPHNFGGYAAGSNPIFVNPVSTSDATTPLEITASVLRVEQQHSASDHGDFVVPVRYQILALDSQHMKGLPEVSIDLLKTADGELFILQTDTLPEASFVDALTSSSLPFPTESSSSLDLHKTLDHDGEHRVECSLRSSFACRMKHFVTGKWDSLKHGKPPCPYRKGVPHARPFDEKDEMMAFEMEDEPPHPHHRPQHHEISRQHHGQRHGVFYSIARSLVGSLIPIFAGITVGLSVSFIALTLGRVVSWSINRFRYGPNSSRPQTRRRAQDRARDRSRGRIDAADLAEGKILLADDDIDIPPAYEHAPAYDEIV